MRTYTVHTKEEFEKERNNLIVATYKTKQEVGGESARLIKKKKVSAGFCVLWFILGIFPPLYLSYLLCR